MNVGDFALAFLAGAMGAIAVRMWMGAAHLPKPNYRMAIGAALLSSTVRDCGNGYEVEVHINGTKFEQMLPHAAKAVNDGLLTEAEAVKMLAAECCTVGESE